MSVTQLNLVSTSAADGGGTEGLIQTPILQPAEAGYNYGFTDGFMEYGAGTAGSLPFKVDEHGNVTSAAHTASGVISQNAGSDSAGSAPILTAVAGTNGGGGVQLSDTTRDYMVYLQVGTAGTAWVVTMGHTSSANDVTLHASGTATAGQTLSFRLPAGWYFLWTATTATLAQSVAVGC